ncbi:MAG: alkylhydroperoxidase-related (seleno)protein [Acidobacteriota bacterium]|nr:alkylhydroperoxidase-related (seleno)protein [Acidobacteriota bacterium]MDE3263937.1 alkylhydroperoxidase-related (seleno)protein [Acidobacteriota bacterium]
MSSDRMGFDAGRFPVPVREDLTTALRRSWADIGRPGTWWTGPERVAIAALARAERIQRNEPPWGRNRGEPDTALPEKAIEAARKIGADPMHLDREWAEGIIAEIGDARYVELASVVVTTVAADAFCEAMGIGPEPLPEPEAGEPTAERPDGMGDIGAWVPVQVVDWKRANVARALSLVPEGVRTFFRMVVAMYSGAATDFEKMVWDHRPLSRPQVELIAARVSALNQCFY